MLDEEMRKRVYELEHTCRRKYHSLNVPKVAYDVYRNNIISISKFESIINKYDKTLSDFKVIRPEVKPINMREILFKLDEAVSAKISVEAKYCYECGFKDGANILIAVKD